MFGNAIMSVTLYVWGLILNFFLKTVFFGIFWMMSLLVPGANQHPKDSRIVHQSNATKSEWWNETLYLSWPQLSEYMVVKVTHFLNNLFSATSHLSIIQSLRVQSVNLGNESPHLKNIKIYRCFSVAHENLIVSDFDLSWISDCSIVIQLNLNILGRSQVHCVITNISLQGAMTAEMSGLVPAIPPFSKVRCHFTKRPALDLQLKFKNSSVGTIRVGHSVIGKTLAALVRDKLIEQTCKELMYPRGVEIDIRST